MGETTREVMDEIPSKVTNDSFPTVTLSITGGLQQQFPMQKTFKLAGHDFTIVLGRGSRAHAQEQAGRSRVCIQNPTVSSQHAEIKFVAAESELYLSDTKSLHGTKLNGRKLLPNEAIQLHSQDEITLCKPIMTKPTVMHEPTTIRIDVSIPEVKEADIFAGSPTRHNITKKSFTVLDEEINMLDDGESLLAPVEQQHDSEDVPARLSLQSDRIATAASSSCDEGTNSQQENQFVTPEGRMSVETSSADTNLPKSSELASSTPMKRKADMISKGVAMPITRAHKFIQQHQDAGILGCSRPSATACGDTVAERTSKKKPKVQDRSNTKPFLLGMLAGSVGLIGALVSLPDSLF